MQLFKGRGLELMSGSFGSVTPMNPKTWDFLEPGGGSLPETNRHSPWKSPSKSWKIPSKWWIFHGYVSLQECNLHAPKFNARKMMLGKRSGVLFGAERVVFRGYKYVSFRGRKTFLAMILMIFNQIQLGIRISADSVRRSFISLTFATARGPLNLDV